jgi:hypothetical protein
MKSTTRKAGKASKQKVPPRASAAPAAPKFFGWGDKSHEAVQAFHGRVDLNACPGLGKPPATDAALPREHADLISELSRLVDRAGSLDLPRTRQALSELVRTAAQEVADRMSTNLRGIRSLVESAARASD